LRIFHSDARFYSEQQNRICYVLQDMKLKLSRIKQNFINHFHD
jgi:hypothetical protein